jgi:HTH-type transcriptional regulator/antitoxin HipB
MELIARDGRQLGAAIRRNRKKRNLTQGELAKLMQSRQATVSTLERGEPATVGTLLDALAALDLEIVIRRRSTKSLSDILQDAF